MADYAPASPPNHDEGLSPARRLSSPRKSAVEVGLAKFPITEEDPSLIQLNERYGADSQRRIDSQRSIAHAASLHSAASSQDSVAARAAASEQARERWHRVVKKVTSSKKVLKMFASNIVVTGYSSYGASRVNSAHQPRYSYMFERPYNPRAGLYTGTRRGDPRIRYTHHVPCTRDYLPHGLRDETHPWADYEEHPPQWRYVDELYIENRQDPQSAILTRDADLQRLEDKFLDATMEYPHPEWDRMFQRVHDTEYSGNTRHLRVDWQPEQPIQMDPFLSRRKRKLLLCG